jgi:hypothetical protein
METISVIREMRENQIIPATRNTLRYVPLLLDKKPTAGKNIIKNPQILERKVTGCIVTRMTITTAPVLLLLATGEIEVEGHRPQTRGIYYHELITLDTSLYYFGIETKNETHIREYLNLIIESFELRGERGSAIYMKIDVSGRTETTREKNSENIEVLEEIKSERYFFVRGNEISVNGEVIEDTAGFKLEGKLLHETVKTHTFSIRRKETDKVDFSFMRSEITAELTFTNPEEYETGYKASFKISLERLVYEGEESYPDASGVWGRNFRYRVYGSLKVRVYTNTEEL